MPLRIETPLMEQFILEETDSRYNLDKTAEPTKIMVKQATQGQHEKRQVLFEKMEREMVEDEQGIRTISHARFNYAELQRLEVYLTLVDCNIEGPDAKPLFKFKNNALTMSEAEFRKAWDLLPVDVAGEIHDKVLEVNIGWQLLSGNR